MALRHFYDMHSWNLTLNHDHSVVTRTNREGSGLVYMMEELAVDESCCFMVEAVDDVIDGLNSLSLVIGLTTCDPSVITNFPSHVIEPCQPSHDCMGHTMTIQITCAHLLEDEIRMQRKAGGVLQVCVNDVPQFCLMDPNDSVFPFSKNTSYPFLMLSGSVSKVRSIPASALQMIQTVEPGMRTMTSHKGHRTDNCCVICMDRSISHMAVPCNHAAFCDIDANEHMRNSKTCPVCRKRVTSFVRIYLS